MIRAPLILQLIFICTPFSWDAQAAKSISESELTRTWPESIPSHPRLFFSGTNVARMKVAASRHGGQEIQAALLHEAKRLLTTRPVQRVQTGRRLLSVSREALHRLMHWGFAHRLGADIQTLPRAVQEMDAISGFRDWNPSHFLDVAEMTLALAIGYDTYYPKLSIAQRRRYRNAILRLGIRPSFQEKQWWVTRENNWNQVCHGGLLAGAFAVMEDEPELAREVVRRAVNSLPHAMTVCAPDGAYPEGPMYWVYGTTYNVIALDLMQQVLGTTFNLEETPGFMASADYFLHMTGPSGHWFDYADCSRRRSITPTPGWFARQTGRSELNWNERRLWKLFPDCTRFSPLLLLWVPDTEPIPPKALSWRGRGSNPVAVHRDGWTDPNARFLGIKGGSPSTNHAQMDLGSFIFESQGVRWVIELGKESYHNMEKRGFKLWGSKNGSDRWKITRNHNRGHNTLVVNGREQVAAAHARITGFNPMPKALTRIDLTPAYAPQLTRVIRTASFTDSGMLLEDELTVGTAEADIEWAFHTRSRVRTTDNGNLLLIQNGKILEIKAAPKMTWKLQPLDQMENEWDTPDPAVTRCSFNVILEPTATQKLTVGFSPALIPEK